MVLIAVPQPHNSPYPVSDRHVSFTEMIYHVGLVRQDIRDLKAVLTEQRKEDAEEAEGQRAADASELEGRRRSWRWAVGIAVAASTSASSLIIQITH